MRVLQVNKFHYVKGGAERYYLDLSEALTRAGHEVSHLAMAHERNLPAGNGDAFVSGVDYRGPMSASERARQGFRSIYNREAAGLAERQARAGERPVAHLHNIYHQLSPSVIRAFARQGVPIVQTLHDYKLVCPAYLLMTEGAICERCRGGHYYQAVTHRCLLDSRGASMVAAVEAYLHAAMGTYGMISRFLCPSRFLMDKVASFGISSERLIHLPYFLPAGRYRPADGISPGEGSDGSGVLRCVYVGRISREKGIATLIDAMAMLPPGRLTLDVLGEGPLRGQLEERVRERCPDGRVRFLGYLSGDALHDAVRAAAFAVVPSEWYENLPFAVLEPFALGRPVVGARIGGIPELVWDGRTGRCFESGDSESLAHALLWMTGPQADLEKMGREARRIIVEEHAEGPHLERLFAIYREVSA